MVDNKKKKGLGRGLSALLSDAPAAKINAPAASDQEVPIDLIAPNPDQPRRSFDATELDELAASIREKGVLQPLLLRPDPKGGSGYQIIAGERRWRAAQIAKLHKIPAVIRAFSDEEVLEAAIIENIQRADLNPIEEAAGYSQLVEKFGHNQTRLAEAMGKSRAHVANMLRLLSLPEDVRQLLAEGRLTAGHARALITADNPSKLARHVVDNGLSVRETEALAKAASALKVKRKRPSGKDADTQVLESDLTAAIGLKVAIAHKGRGGSVTIQYKDLEELDGLCRLLNGGD